MAEGMVGAGGTGNRRASAADVRHLDLGQPGSLRRADLGVAVGSHPPDGRNDIGYLCVTSSLAQEGPQVLPLHPKQTGEELPFRREACPRAIAADRLAARADPAAFARPVPVPPALG